MPLQHQQSLAAVLGVLTQPRLRNYRTFFSAKSDREAYGLYAWNESLSACFGRVLGTLEIAMRNQFHSAMSHRFGVAGTTASRDWFNHIQLSCKSRAAVTELTHRKQRVGRSIQHVPRNPMPSPDDVVSKLTFGFWPRLLDVNRDANGQRIDWADIITDVLPGHRQRDSTFWKAQKQQDALFARIDLCNGLRNRIAHHEPIWRAGPLLEEARTRKNVQPAVLQAAPSTPAEAIVRLGICYQCTIELLEWFSKELAVLVRSTETHHRFLALNSLVTLDDFRRHAGMSRAFAIELASHREPGDLKAEFLNLRRTHGAVSVCHAGHQVGYFMALSQNRYEA